MVEVGRRSSSRQISGARRRPQSLVRAKDEHCDILGASPQRAPNRRGLGTCRTAPREMERCMGRCTGHCMGRCTGRCMGRCTGRLSRAHRLRRLRALPDWFSSCHSSRRFGRHPSRCASLTCVHRDERRPWPYDIVTRRVRPRRSRSRRQWPRGCGLQLLHPYRPNTTTLSTHSSMDSKQRRTAKRLFLKTARPRLVTLRLLGADRGKLAYCETLWMRKASPEEAVAELDRVLADLQKRTR